MKRQTDITNESYLQTVWRRFKHHHLGVASLILLTVICLAAVLAPLIAPHDQEIKRLRSMKQFIRHEKQNVQEALDVRLDEPYLVRREECWLLLSDVKGREERKLAEEIAQHVRLREQYRVTQSAVGTICLGQDLDQGKYNRYVCVYSRITRPVAGLKTLRKRAGQYVEVCYRGYEDSMEKPYHLIREYAERQGLRLGREWYEDFLLDELTVKGYGDYIVKVAVEAL